MLARVRSQQVPIGGDVVTQEPSSRTPFNSRDDKSHAGHQLILDCARYATQSQRIGGKTLQRCPGQPRNGEHTTRGLTIKSTGRVRIDVRDFVVSKLHLKLVPATESGQIALIAVNCL